MKKVLISFLFVFLSIIIHGQDTFSICAVDPTTGQVGSAGASCLDDSDIPGGVLIISDVHPGVGVIHTQSYWNPANQQYARQLMDDGYSPQEIITLLALNDAQNNPSIRQYGIVDLSGDTARAAAFTGENCFDYKNHIIGPNYAIQGNILLGQEILDSIESRFLNAEGSLACRLMEALQGANVVGADTRCAPYGVSSLSAFIRVAKPDDPDDNLYLEFIVPEVFPGVDPIDSLQTLVDQWGGCNLTGTDIITEKQMVDVFPNPASKVVNFELHESLATQSMTLTIYNTVGQQMFQRNFHQSNNILWAIPGVPKGLYTYNLRSTDNISIQGKFLVE